MRRMSGFVVFFGRAGTSEVERKLDTIRIAIGALLAKRAGEAGWGHVLAVTRDDEAAAAFRAAGATVDRDEAEPFHFGAELARIVEAKRLQRVCAIGAGAGALLMVEQLRAIREDLEATDALVLSNNYYSADLVAFTPTSALGAIALPPADNPLPRLLHQQAGLPSRQLERSSATLLDVDTPADATVLRRHPACPPELARLGAWETELGARIEALMRIVTTPERELVVAGRVGAPVWTYLESQTACRVRMLAEERGMQAAGRDVTGHARTALGFLYQQVGPEAFFARMGELGDGMLFDTRVLFAHLGWRPAPPERFASDLFDAERITSPALRAFTAAAGAAPYPLLLGGQALVSGVLWTMVEAAWAGHPEEAA
jgi:CTP:molybdopterin cytidylyltransferase MocA